MMETSRRICNRAGQSTARGLAITQFLSGARSEFDRGSDHSPIPSAEVEVIAHIPWQMMVFGPQFSTRVLVRIVRCSWHHAGFPTVSEGSPNALGSYDLLESPQSTATDRAAQSALMVAD
jgi:hypothetical protein